jgi:hypothetical protein
MQSMMRNLKVLGLGLVAMLAMSAMAASSASASFSSTDEHTFLTSSGEDQLFFVTPGAGQRGFECDSVSLNTTTSTFLEADKTVEQVTVGPQYSNCVTKEPDGLQAHVEMTGCHYLFTDETNAQGRAPVHVVCEQETEEIHVKVTSLKLACSTIPGTNTANVGTGETHNQNLTGVKYVNNGNHIDIEANITGITSTTQGGCQAEGEPTIHHNGVYTGNVTVSGHDTGGNILDLGYTTP